MCALVNGHKVSQSQSEEDADRWKSTPPGSRDIELRPKSLEMVRGSTREIRGSTDYEAEGLEPLFTHTTNDGVVYHEVMISEGGLRLVLFTNDNGGPGEMVSDTDLVPASTLIPAGV